jgi:hypothetical protein
MCHTCFHFIPRHHTQTIGVNGDNRFQEIERLLFG